MKTALFLVILAAAMISCGERQATVPNPEVQGQLWLSKARMALSNSDFVAARSCIDSLRSRCAEALNAREHGILLLDSIELAEAHRQLADAQKAAAQQGLDIYARDSADTHLDRMVTKVRFFEKKLEHDIAGFSHHEQ